MTVMGVRVRVTPEANDVVVLLREEDDRRRAVPILIGPHEGVAIASAQSRLKPSRPGPYDLVIAALNACTTRLERVEIIELTDGIFFAELVLSNGTRIDSRTSDAVALALRADVDIYCAEEIVNEAGLVLESETEDEEMYMSHSADPEEELAEFRSFLDDVDPADFADPEE